MLVKHPYLSDLYFTQEGEPFKDADGLIPYNFTSNVQGAYPRISYKGKEVLLHRLVATTFHGTPKDKPIVNHLDGITYNYHPDNLEWTTSSGNNIHAYMTGLRSDNKPLKIWDRETRTFTQKHSLTETARFIGVNPSLIHDYLRSVENGNLYLYRRRYAIAPIDFEWGDLLLLTGEETASGITSVIYAVHPDLRRVIKFTSRMHGCRYFGIKQHKMETLLKGKRDNRLNGWKFVYRLEDFPSDTTSFTLEEPSDDYTPNKAPPPVKKPRPVAVKDLLTDVEDVYPSLKSFAESIGVKHATIGKGMYLNPIGDNGGKWRNYQIQYLQR